MEDIVLDYFVYGLEKAQAKGIKPSPSFFLELFEASHSEIHASAVHEAAHFLSAVSAEYPIPAYVTIDFRTHKSPHVTLLRPALSTPTDCENYVAICLAGMMAEIIIFRTRKVQEERLAAFGRGESDPIVHELLKAFDAGIIGAYGDMANIEDAFTRPHSLSTTEKQAAYTRGAYIATDFVIRNQLAIERLAKMLIEKRTVDGLEANKVFPLFHLGMKDKWAWEDDNWIQG
jgi:hypothetical protein